MLYGRRDCFCGYHPQVRAVEDAGGAVAVIIVDVSDGAPINVSIRWVPSVVLVGVDRATGEALIDAACDAAGADVELRAVNTAFGAAFSTAAAPVVASPAARSSHTLLDPYVALSGCVSCSSERVCVSWRC